MNYGGSKYGNTLTYKLVMEILNKLKGISKYSRLVGSTGRLKKKPEDIDMLTLNINKLFNEFKKRYKDIKLLEKGPKQIFYLIKYKRKKAEINLWKTTKADFPAAYFQYAYPQKLVIALRNKAKHMGYLLNQHGLYKNNRKVRVKNYLELFDKLDVPRRTPIEQTIRDEKYKHIKDTKLALHKIRTNKEVAKRKKQLKI